MTDTDQNHVPALDGLRGVAILMVMVFHVSLWLKWETPVNLFIANGFTCGWVGVDVFFVLSGFLITRILLYSKGKPNFFRNFYARRFLRTTPVYYLLLTVIFLILPHFVSFDTEGLQKIQRNQGWMWAHLTNLGFVWHQGVWAFSDWLVLDHLWSLAVEEQFYVVWPWIVFMCDRRTLKKACVLFVVFPPALRAILWGMNMPNGALYFPTPCRLDGLAMGAFIAVSFQDGTGLAVLHFAFQRLAVGSLVMLGALVTWRGGLRFTDSPCVVFGPTLINIITASVVVHVLQPGKFNIPSRILSLTPLQIFGKYSYGIYLFHVPLLIPLRAWALGNVLMDKTHGELAGNFLFILLFLGVSLALAFVSWHVYEKQWLKLKYKFRTQA